uniref:Cytochrome P450 93A3-like n=1 Tax=Nicotiana sylvestris TaxID=4096 RepID=A0A1U7Y5S5_NICSY|nr:PREDICTED: cytochrome P450 93A3-like [Nicotiana sylvestris]
MAYIQECIFFFLVWLISTIFIRKLFRNRSTCSCLPPSPIALPIIGHLHLLGHLPHQAFHKLSNQYGPLIHLRLGSVPCVVASSPEMAKEFLKAHEISFASRPKTVAVDCLAYDAKGFSFAPYGPYTKSMKKLCVSELLGGRTIDLLLPNRRDEIRRFIALLTEKAKYNEAVDLGGELLRLANNVVSRMIMSKRCSENEDEAGGMRKLIQEFAELTGKFNLSDFMWFCKDLDLQGFRKSAIDIRNMFDEMIERIINEHQVARRKRNHEGEVVKDLLDILLDKQEDESFEIRLSRENIKAFIMDMFAAGSDTSAIMIEWALAELINHPRIMQKAVQEIDSVVGKNRLVEESDIENLPYLQAIIKETLRLHPAAPMIVRISSEDCKIGEYAIPAKTRLFVNIWSINRNQDYWENPLEFQPERFLSEEKSAKVQLDVRGQHYEFLPFGSGRRGCPGTSLALKLVHTTLAAMIQCFQWKVNREGNDKMVDMEEGPITIPRAHPLICVPVARIDALQPSMCG